MVDRPQIDATAQPVEVEVQVVEGLSGRSVESVLELDDQSQSHQLHQTHLSKAEEVD